MASKSTAAAVRSYLAVLRDPSSLRDEDALAKLREQLEGTDDDLERLRLRQQILDMEHPSIDRYEDEFVMHAKEWAEEHGVTPKAFEAEGVPGGVLRRAGMAPSAQRRRKGTRTRVTVDEVRSLIPRGSFTIRRLQEISGASPAVVRKVVTEELESGRLKELGTDPDHTGPGRAPVLYKKGR